MEDRGYGHRGSREGGAGTSAALRREVTTIIPDFSAIVTKTPFRYTVPGPPSGGRIGKGGRTEQFDVLDCAGRKTGARISRDEAHASGVWHGAFHCLMVYRREGRDLALFQRRSRDKQIAPGLFDVSVGGHYAAGEDAMSAGPREILEELGLAVPFVSLVPVGRRTFVYCFMPGVLEYEFQDVFLLPLDDRPKGLILQEGEVDAVLELGVEEGIGLFAGQRASVNGLLRSAGGQEMTIPVTAAGFVPSIDSYYLKLLQLAERCLRGDRKALAI